MKRNHPNKGTTMDHIEMNETRAATMRRVLDDRPLLKMLRPEDREALLIVYTEKLIEWERSNG